MNMSNKIKDPRFDGTKGEDDWDDEAWTTDFEDDDLNPMDTEIYKSYRLMQKEQKMKQADFDKMVKKMNQTL